MSRIEKRTSRIREEIPIQRVLSDYGRQVDSEYDGEQQFSCDMHGNGSDSKPSARVYPASASWYCFACDRTRDAIETVREKEGLGFWDAVKLLESRYGLPPLPWDDEDRDEATERAREQERQNVMAQLQAVLDPTRTFEDDCKPVERMLQDITQDRDLPMGTVLRYWEAYDMVCHLVSQAAITEESGRKRLAEIMAKAKKRAIEHARMSA